MEAHKDMEAHRDTLLSEEPLLENSIERRSEKIIDIKGVKHHTTDSWRACTYILGNQKKSKFHPDLTKMFKKRRKRKGYESAKGS
jgi:hypothetical protein